MAKPAWSWLLALLPACAAAAPGAPVAAVASVAPSPVATITPSPVATITPSPVATITPSPVATITPSPVATITIDWARGMTGLGFYDMFVPQLPNYDFAHSPAPGAPAPIAYRLVGRGYAKTGLQPSSAGLGQSWACDFFDPAKSQSRRALPGSGVPVVSQPLEQAADAYQPGYALDRAAVRVDSDAAAAKVAGSPTGDVALLSGGEYARLTGHAASAPVWRFDVLPSGVAYVDARTGAVL